MTLTVGELAGTIEHTLLKADATRAQVERLCHEAADLRLFGVCVNPFWVPLARATLAGRGVRVVTVCGFPLGAEVTSVKVAQAVAAIDLGADEVDMVINIGALHSGEPTLVEDDIAAVAAACHSRGVPLKTILELSYLTQAEKEQACTLAVSAGADFVKTATGFGPGGATVDDVALLRRLAPEQVGVKAAGGIRDLAGASAMLAAGASRIGTSAGAAIVRAAGAHE